ncbi:MAG: YwqG family protein [Erysipelotrichales bacterium]|nr:YwqG family protein [Erysipelotrichales bacterium]
MGIFHFFKKKPKESKFVKERAELTTLGLTTIEDLENLVKPLVRDALKVIPKKANNLEGSNLKSQIGGTPYFERGESWPKTKDGTYLQFICQIFNDGNSGLPDNIKLLQFYYAVDGEYMAFETADKGWLVKVYENLDKANVAIVPKPENEHFEEWDNVEYCELSFKKIKSLPDWEGISHYSKNASNLSCILNEDEPWANYEKIKAKLTEREYEEDEEIYISQIGGYPAWVQGDDTPEGCEFLLQLNSEEETTNLMWGDMGLVYFFYNKKNKKIEFILQCG